MHQTRIFMNGASQAVRLPAECRFAKPDVCVARVGSMVVIYPKDAAWDLFQSALGSVSDDFHRPAQGAAEGATDRDSDALDPTPAAVRTRVYRKKTTTSSTVKKATTSIAKRSRKSV